MNVWLLFNTPLGNGVFDRLYREHILWSEGEYPVSTVIIGGNGRAAIQRLADAYPNMDHDRRAAAVALERDICQQIDAFLSHDSDGDQSEDGDEDGQ